MEENRNWWVFPFVFFLLMLCKYYGVCQTLEKHHKNDTIIVKLDSAVYMDFDTYTDLKICELNKDTLQANYNDYIAHSDSVQQEAYNKIKKQAFQHQNELKEKDKDCDKQLKKAQRSKTWASIKGFIFGSALGLIVGFVVSN